MKPIALVLAAALFSVAGASAQTAPSAADANRASTDASVLRLLREFRSLFDSLQSAGGLREENMPPIRRFSERLAAALSDRPLDLQLLGLDVQLSMWLGEDDRVDQAFGKLVETSGGERRYAVAWVGYFNTKPDQGDRLDRIREDLIRINPTDKTYVLDWATQLEQQARFERSLQLLDSIDATEFPRSVVIRARCLVATDRIDAALAALDAISAETLEANATLRADVVFLKGLFKEYPERWSAEQELRSQDAARDDLPRAEIVTAAGRVVVELFEDSAPNTVANFIALAEIGFYDLMKVHIVVPGQRLEVGDPASRTDGASGAGNPGYFIEDEITVPNPRSHFAGSLTMVKGRGVTDRAGSIFAISLRPEPARNGTATVFGRVIEGNDLLRRTNRGDTVEAVRILRKRDHAYEVRKIETADASAAPAAAPVAPEGFAPEPVSVPTVEPAGTDEDPGR